MSSEVEASLELLPERHREIPRLRFTRLGMTRWLEEAFIELLKANDALSNDEIRMTNGEGNPND